MLLKAAVLVIKEFSKDVSSQAKDTSAKGAKTNDKVRSGKEKEVIGLLHTNFYLREFSEYKYIYNIYKYKKT